MPLADIAIGGKARTAPAATLTGHCGVIVMLYYAVIFFVIALIAAIFGFTGLAAGAASIAKLLFFVFLIFAAVTFVFSLMRGRA